MSVFISPNDYTFLAGSCIKTIHNLCGHNYQLWCLQGSEDKVNDIVNDIMPIVEKTAVKHSGLTFDKILLMAVIDYLIKNEKTSKVLSSVAKMENENINIKINSDNGNSNLNASEEYKNLERQLQKLQKENEKLSIENEKQKCSYYENLKKLMDILVDVKQTLLQNEELADNNDNKNQE